MSDFHTPQVEIVTPRATDDLPVIPAVLCTVRVDGQLWPAVSYSIATEGGASGYQTVTITFHADVTVRHPE